MKNTFKKYAVKASVVAGSVVASGAAFADSGIGTAITGAVTEGQANYTLVVVGLIGLAALGFGLHHIMRSMNS